VIAVLDAAGEGDPGALRQEDLGVRAAACVEKIAAVDHRRRHGGPVDHGARAWPPCLAGVHSVKLGGGIPDELEAVAALDQGEPLRDQALKLHRPHLRAVLLPLPGTLCPLVVIEVALDPVDAAMEHVYERPQERVQVRLQPRVRKRRDQRIEYVGKGALQLRGLGQRTRIGLIVKGTMGI
jgi:hypothetical protein